MEQCTCLELLYSVEWLIGGKVLWAQRSERDLGVVMQCDLKVDMQCGRAANEANNKFGGDKKQSQTV